MTENTLFCTIIETIQKETSMNQPGTIRLFLGLILVFGAVGGMDDPDLADYFGEQMIVAVLGLGLMMWAVRAINRKHFG